MNIARTSNGLPNLLTVSDPLLTQALPVPAPEALLPETPVGALERVAPDPAAQNASRLRASVDAQAQRMRSSLEGGLGATAGAQNASGDFASDPRVVAMVLELLQQLGFDVSSLTHPAARQAMQDVQGAAGLPSTGDLDLDTLLALMAAAAQRDRDGDAAPSGGGTAGGAGGATSGGAASGARQAGPAGSPGGGTASPAASGTRQTKPVDVSNWEPGNGDVTAQQLNQIVPTMNAKKAGEVAPHLNRAMAEANINTPQRKAAFIAQVAHESGGFKYNEEIASGRAYEGRADLGNTQPGDGVKFKGRGYIQLTGRANYTAAGKALGLDLVNQPELAAKPENAARVAAWYWNSRGLNKYVDQGNFDEVTRRINGGYNGKADRDQYFDRGLTVLKDNQGLPSTGQFVDKPVAATTANAQVDSNNPTLRKLATGNLQGAGTGLCVTATLDNMQRFGIPQPAATGNDVGNNPRGGMVQMMKDYGWKSVPLPGATQQTIKSPYGTVNANVIPAAEYQKLAEQGKIPSGALVFQTRHASWNSTSDGSRGFDMGIARDGGRNLFNYADMGGPMVYGGSTRSVVVLVPGNALR